MSESENEKTVRKFYEALFQSDFKSGFALLADDFLSLDATLRKRNKDEYKEAMIHEFTAFPDAQIDIVNMISKGNIVVIEYNWRGTQTGEYMRKPPTDIEYEAPAVDICELENNLIREKRLYANPSLWS